jgi:hypothetical protein
MTVSGSAMTAMPVRRAAREVLFSARSSCTSLMIIVSELAVFSLSNLFSRKKIHQALF